MDTYGYVIYCHEICLQLTRLGHPGCGCQGAAITQGGLVLEAEHGRNLMMGEPA